MLKPKFAPAASFAEHLNNLRKVVANFAEHHDDEDLLLTWHKPGARHYLTRAAVMVLMIGLWIGYFVVRPFTDSKEIENAVMFSAAAVTGYYYWSEKRSKQKRLEQKARVKVAAGAMMQAHTDAFDPNIDRPVVGGCFLVTDDPALEADPARLVKLASELFDWRDADNADVPPDVRPVVDWLRATSEDAVRGFTPVPVPASYTGSDRTWAMPVAIWRDRMPNGVLDRRLLPIFWDPTNDQVMPETPELKTWWSEEIDELFYPDLGEEEDEHDADEGSHGEG
ncbi:MAG: hypothetical protein O3B85_14535 [Planctomycetota bacterium]|nr:hypothetical protein [Planctomycetota bacterium]